MSVTRNRKPAKTVTTLRQAEALCRKVGAAREAIVAARRLRRFKPTSAWASQLSACPRQMYYDRVAWDQRDPLPLHVLRRMDVGRWLGAALPRVLDDAGLPAYMTEMPFEIEVAPGATIRGRIDVVTTYRKRGTKARPGRIVKIPVEIKTTRSTARRCVETLDALHEQEWTRRYLRQLWCYCRALGVDTGILAVLIVPDGDLILHAVRVPARDWIRVAADVAAAHDAAEAAAADSAENIEEHAPDRIPYTESVCGLCSWRSTCLPLRGTEPIVNIDDPEIIDAAETVAALDALASRYKRARSTLHKCVSKIPGNVATVGDYLIQTTRSTRRTFKVAPEALDALKEMHPDWFATSEVVKIASIDSTRVGDSDAARLSRFARVLRRANISSEGEGGST